MQNALLFCNVLGFIRDARLGGVGEKGTGVIRVVVLIMKGVSLPGLLRKYIDSKKQTPPLIRSRFDSVSNINEKGYDCRLQ